MKFTKLLIFLSICSIILNSCSSFREVGEVMRNDKQKTTDEFLVKKKDILIQPPDFQEIPEPGSLNKKAESKQKSIEKLLKVNPSKSGVSQTKSSSVEESILNQIKK